MKKYLKQEFHYWYTDVLLSFLFCLLLGWKIGVLLGIFLVVSGILLSFARFVEEKISTRIAINSVLKHCVCTTCGKKAVGAVSDLWDVTNEGATFKEFAHKSWFFFCEEHRRDAKIERTYPVAKF